MFFVIFTISERINAQKLAHGKSGLEEFNLDMRPDITADSVHARPGCVLVAVRDYNQMAHLQTVLEKTNLRRHDIVVMTVRPVSTGAGEYELSEKQLFSDYEKELLSRVVTHGRKARQDRGPAGCPRRRPFRRHGADRAKTQGIASGHRRLAAHGFRRAGAAHRPRVGKAARAAPPVFARNHQRRAALDLCQPGSAPAALMARRSRPRARLVAEAIRKTSARACIIAT